MKLRTAAATEKFMLQKTDCRKSLIGGRDGDERVHTKWTQLQVAAVAENQHTHSLPVRTKDIRGVWTMQRKQRTHTQRNGGASSSQHNIILRHTITQRTQSHRRHRPQHRPRPSRRRLRWRTRAASQALAASLQWTPRGPRCCHHWHQRLAARAVAAAAAPPSTQPEQGKLEAPLPPAPPRSPLRWR